ncbi:helix-turn-helix domain-containing protein [Mycobacterium tuberculosis]|nr:helix-turn-helix domain-containing protein [Mycobacterium tuberculosis]
MSWETQSWAAKQRPGSASAKLVLLGLASCADQNHCAFPSIQWLCDFSDLNRKTVIAALQRLEEGMFPLITDTGDRRGRTGQVKVYQLAVNEGSGREIGAQIHYCYRLIHPETGQYYIGVRSFIGDPLTDTYSGSGKWPLEMKAAGVRLEKEVLAIKDTRDEADIAEALAIKNSIGDPRCMNIEYKDTEKGVPKTGLLKNTKNGTIEDGNSPNLGSKQSQKRDTEPFREPNPPSSPNGDDPPKPKKSVRSDGLPAPMPCNAEASETIGPRSTGANGPKRAGLPRWRTGWAACIRKSFGPQRLALALNRSPPTRISRRNQSGR